MIVFIPAMASKRPQGNVSVSGSSTGMKPLVVAGPSGSGKSSLLKLLFKEYPNSFGFSVSREYLLYQVELCHFYHSTICVLIVA